MLSGHSTIASQRALIKRMGSQGNGIRIAVTGTITGTSSTATMYIAGLTIGNLTQSQQNLFRDQLAIILGVSSDMITLTFESGSLILIININPLKISTKTDNAFVVNAKAAIARLKNADIASIISSSGTSLSITGTANIDYSRTVVSIDIELEKNCLLAYPKQTINNPIVGDNANNCMYTLLNSKIVRINKNGATDIICSFSESVIDNIFITINSDYLVIPLRVNNTGRVYVIKISNGTVYINTLSSYFIKILGFNQFNNKIIYVADEIDNYRRYIAEIMFSTGDISSTLLTINFLYMSKLIFKDQDSGYYIAGSSQNISQFRLSTNEISIIAGGVSDSQPTSGRWSNVATLNSGWGEGGGNNFKGPFKNGPGNDSFFTLIKDIFLDTANNRILVVDKHAQRIRSVDLTNNYTVTTLAGTSPIYYGFAINGYQGIYTSPSFLETLGQIGTWANGVNSMPAFSKVNSTYDTSTFNNPTNVVMVNNTILVLDSTGTRCLSNGYVSDFTVI